MIIVNTVDNHEKHKGILLNKISEFKNYHSTLIPPIDGNIESSDLYSKAISTDWLIDKEVSRPYLDYFYNNVIEPTLIKIGEDLRLGPVNCEVRNAWFQQYEEFGVHQWHNHAGTQFANVYFLELPDGEYVTEIQGLNKKLIKYSAKEGDVITFPSWLLHRSKPNGKGRKSVIAFNTCYEHKGVY